MVEHDIDETLLTDVEAADFLQMRYDKFKKIMIDGQIPFINIGKGKIRPSRRFKKSDLLWWKSLNVKSEFHKQVVAINDQQPAIVAIIYKTAREISGLTQEDLATLADAHVSSVIKLEKKGVVPPQDVLMRIRVALKSRGCCFFNHNTWGEWVEPAGSGRITA